MDDRALLLGFQPLGSGCEFGLVQRQCGVEALGLLRWAHMPFWLLVAALEDGLPGIGELGNTELETPVWGEEYYTIDKRYHMRCHTWLRLDTPVPDDLLTRRCRQLRYLRDKLVEDLTEGWKICVFTSRDEVLPDDFILRLWRALQGWGPNRLLVVQPPGAGAVAGTLRLLGADVAVGNMGRFVFDYGRDKVALADWLVLLRAARAEWPAA